MKDERLNLSHFATPLSHDGWNGPGGCWLQLVVVSLRAGSIAYPRRSPYAHAGSSYGYPSSSNCYPGPHAYSYCPTGCDPQDVVVG